MGRPKIDLSHEVATEIAARAARGESAATIHAAMGARVSVATIKRRVAELRGKAPASRQGPSRAKPGKPATVERLPSVGDVPDDPPEGTPIEQIDRWLLKLEHAASAAEAQGNLSALASIAAKVTALHTLRIRAMPLPKPDPDDNPDFKALAKQGEARLMTLLKGVFADTE